MVYSNEIRTLLGVVSRRDKNAGASAVYDDACMWISADPSTIRKRETGLPKRSCSVKIFAPSAALVCSVTLASAAPPSQQRPGERSCREAVNGLISMLAARTDNTALYHDTYVTVVETCGPEHDPKKWKPVFRKDHAPIVLLGKKPLFFGD